MTKMPFENSEILQQAKVTIDGVDYPVTPAQMKAVQHYLSAEELNALQDNIESDLNTKANKTDIIKTATYTGNLTYVSTTTNIEFATMFPNLSLSQIICFNIEITNVNDTWNGVFANIIPNGQLQVRSYNQTQEVTVKVTAFYK